MPVCFIYGPGGLNENLKKELITESLEALVEAYQMPDDRVFISDYPLTNAGHTPQTPDQGWSVQSEPAKPVCRIDAPPGLPIEDRRRLFASITSSVAKAYEVNDLRDILIFLHEYPIENVGNNGLLQTENPEFESPVSQ